MKISELPKGTVIELSDGVQYELMSNWVNIDESIHREGLDDQEDFKIISLPYAVTLQLAKWLNAGDNGAEDFIMEAINDLEREGAFGNRRADVLNLVQESGKENDG
jgi:hypothetical protein